MDNSGNKKSIKNRLRTNSNRSLLSQKKCLKWNKLVLDSSVDESSSCSEDTEVVPRRRKKIVRALSDYESGDNDVGKAGSSSASSSRVNSEEVVTKQTSTQNLRCTSTIKFEDLSSSDSSSDELFVRRTNRRGSVRALSDYDTGDGFYQAGEALQNLSKGNNNDNSSTNSSQQNDDLDSSCDNDTMCNEFKRARNTFSTSDSSDSELSVRQRCIRKRMKIVSSEESDGENTNVVHSHRSCRPNQNDISITNRGADYLDTRPQMTRTLRPRFNNWRSYASTESDSSSVEVVRIVMRNQIDEVNTTVNINSNSSQQNLMEGSRGDSQLNRNVPLATIERSTESNQQNSRPPATIDQIVRRTRNRQFMRRSRTLRRRNNELEAQSLSSGLTESELSSDDMCVINSGIDSSDSDSDLQFQPRRLRGGSTHLNYSDSDSNIEQTLPDAVINSGTSNTLIRSVMQDENSSDSDENSEKCPICFDSFGEKEVASPVSCDHSFCTQCIQEWAKSKNTCPIDRKCFDKILIRPNFFIKKISRAIHIETPPVETRWEVERYLIAGDLIEFPLDDSIISSSEEEDEICCVCLSSSNSHDLILCEMCDRVYHLSCLMPPLRYVPPSNWSCPTCEDGMY